MSPLGIQTSFDSDFVAIDIVSLADEMLAKVVADHAAERFAASNQANALIAGQYVSYSVSLNGRRIYQGLGAAFPSTELQLAILSGSRRGVAALPVIAIDWAFERLSGSALERAVQNLSEVAAAAGRVDDFAAFSQIIINAKDDPFALLRFLLEQYVASRNSALGQTLGYARTLYRIYRAVGLARKLIGGDNSQASEDEVDILAWIAGELRQRSPVLSGEYRDAHALYLDGALLMNAADVVTGARVPGAGEYSFSNTVPYARRIEFGKTESGRAFVVDVPNHVYERLAQEARERFGDTADIQYEMRAVIDAEQTPQRDARRPHNQPDVRYPSIVVRFS